MDDTPRSILALCLSFVYCCFVLHIVAIVISAPGGGSKSRVVVTQEAAQCVGRALRGRLCCCPIKIMIERAAIKKC